jgi:hypothetical protein
VRGVCKVEAKGKILQIKGDVTRTISPAASIASWMFWVMTLFLMVGVISSGNPSSFCAAFTKLTDFLNPVAPSG